MLFDIERELLSEGLRDNTVVGSYVLEKDRKKSIMENISGYDIGRVKKRFCTTWLAVGEAV